MQHYWRIVQSGKSKCSRSHSHHVDPEGTAHYPMGRERYAKPILGEKSSLFGLTKELGSPAWLAVSNRLL